MPKRPQPTTAPGSTSGGASLPPRFTEGRLRRSAEVGVSSGRTTRRFTAGPSEGKQTMADIEVRSSGTRVTAKMLDRIVIHLRENATTGYQWSIREVDGPLESESSEIVASAPLVPGAAGERVIVVRPTAVGRA